MMRKVLIVYATAGIGHKKAAMAVKKAFDETQPKDTEVSMIDALDYSNSFFKWTYLQVYLLMVNNLPFIWGLSYYITDNVYVNAVVRVLRRINNWMNSRKLAAYLLKTQPDVIISTHFFASEVISDMRKSGKLKSHLITVVTDYRLHAWWVSEFTDTYVVAGSAAREDLLRWETPPDKIRVLGIPVEPVFSKKLDKEKILEKSGLKKGVFTALVIGGGFGVGPIEEIIRVIDSVGKTIQVVAICGHNEELVKRLENLKKDLKIEARILGFVDNVYEYMDAADILISKSGGITVSESLAKELPMVIISPIIGQETRNADFLISNGAAFKIAKPADLKDVLEAVTSHPDKLSDMKKAIHGIRKPNSCYDIVNLAMEIAAKP